MTELYPWYGITDTEALEQGHILLNCPRLKLEASGSVSQDSLDVIVLSQSCDLANNKLETVQVCPMWSLDVIAVKVEYLRGKKGREELRRGNLPGYHLLNACVLPGHERDFMVIDFRALFGIPLQTVTELAKQRSPRLRLLPPYREHLAQAFARFFMRVGLPVDVPPF